MNTEHYKIIENFFKQLKQKTPSSVIESNLTLKSLKGITVNREVPTTTFISYVVMFVWFMNTQDMINWTNVDDKGFQCVLWLAFWLIIDIMGFKHNSIALLGMEIMKVWANKNLKPDAKIALIMQIVQQWLGWIADMSQLVDLEQKPEDVKK